MSHFIRYLPPGKFLADITQRCLLGHYLLKLGKRLNLLVAGVVAKALEKYPVELIGLAVPSNHYHLLAAGTSQEDLSSFMNFVAGNVAKEAGRLHGWKGRLWEGRYHCTPVTDEEEIQVARLKYLLSQGCKEGLVNSPRQWPGVHCAKALMTGQGIPGVWVDRTALYNAVTGTPKFPPYRKLILPPTLKEEKWQTSTERSCFRRYLEVPRRKR